MLIDSPSWVRLIAVALLLASVAAGSPALSKATCPSTHALWQLRLVDITTEDGAAPPAVELDRWHERPVLEQAVDGTPCLPPVNAHLCDV